MGKYFRLLIATVLLAAVALLARNNIAWAGPVTVEQQSITAQEQSSINSAKPGPCKGTVCPPPSTITICTDGTSSVGGVATLKVSQLSSEYCLEAFLHHKAIALGRIPDGAGQVLANAMFLRVYRLSRFVYDLPSADGTVEVCYAVPPGIQQAQIYFYDFYGPRFGKRTGQPTWEPLQSTVTGGVACATARTSGVYALIGQ